MRLALIEGVDASEVAWPPYRYQLTRRWGDPVDRVCWIMLNPSVASSTEDDQTLRKIQLYTRRWHYRSLVVVNLFGFRSTTPDALQRVADPVGPQNDHYISQTVNDPTTALVICAWGVHGVIRNRGLIVTDRLAEWGVDAMRLGPLTKGGHPGHPSRRSLKLEPQPL